MEYLNLQKDDPDTLQNKFVMLKGVLYYIGRFISKGKTKLVYQLCNANSHVSSHVIKIYRNTAEAEKLINELMASELMHQLDIGHPNIIIPTQEERDLLYQGGSFHVEELLTGNREYNNLELDTAKQLFAERQYQKASGSFENQVKINPYQTEAILGRFFCIYQKEGFQVKNLRLLDQILDIEPYVKYYYQVSLLVCLLNKHYEGFFHFYQRSKQSSIHVKTIFEKVNTAIENNHARNIQEYIDELRKLYDMEFHHFYENCVDVPLTDIVGDIPFAYGKSIVQFKDNSEIYDVIAYDYSDAFGFNEDENIFEKAVNLFNKDPNNIKAYEMMEDLVERNPNEKKYLQGFLCMAYKFRKYSEFISIYKTMNPNDSTEQLDNMALEAYLKVGLPEKALALSTEIRVPSELRQIIREENQKKIQQAELSEKAYLALVEENNPSKAIELQKKAMEIYPFGIEAIINQIIDCIENGKEFVQMDQILPFTISNYSYFMLHICIYKIISKRFDDGFEYAISEYSKLIKTHYSYLSNADNVPSKLIWYNTRGVLEEPLYITYGILREGYEAVKNSKFNGLEQYAELVERYKIATETQKLNNESID